MATALSAPAVKVKSPWAAFIKLYDMLGIWFWVIVFFAVFACVNEHFLSLPNIRNIFRQASIFSVMSIGMTLVIISGGIDLSVGSVVSCSSAMLGTIWQATGSFPLAIACAMGVGLVSGLANGYLIGYRQMPPFIATFGLMSAAAGFAYALTPGSIGDFPRWFEYLGNGMFRKIPIPIFIMFGLGLVFFFILNRRSFGLRIKAVGGNENSARMAGVNVPALKLAVYAINGLLASFAGIILCSRVRSSYPGIGQDMEMEVIASAVIGGASLVGGEGRIFGAIGGAVFICMIQTLFNLEGIYPFMQKIITGLFIVIAVFANEIRSRRK